MTARRSPRLRVRSDAVAVSVDDGVRWFTDGGISHIRGSSVARLVERLIPALDGSRTLDDLTVSLDSAQRATVRDLTDLCRDLGAVDDVEGPSETTNDRVVRLSGGDAGPFHRLCSGSVAVIGPEAITAALARALRRGGLRTVHASTAGAHPAMSELRSTTAVVQVFALDDLAVGAGPAVTVADEFARRCRARGMPCVQAAISPSYALVVPSEGIVWGDVMARLTPPGRVALLGAQRNDGVDTQGAFGYVGARLARTLIRRVTGASEPEGLVVIDLVNLGTTMRPVVHAAQALVADSTDVRRDVIRLLSTPTVDVPTLDEAAARWIDPWFGVIGELRDADGSQIPQRAVEAHFRAGGIDHVVTGRADGYVAARRRAVLDALGVRAVATALAHHGARADGVRMTDGTRAPATLGSRAGRSVAALSFDALLVGGLGPPLAELVLAGGDGRGAPVDVAGDRVVQHRLACLRAVGLKITLWSLVLPDVETVDVAVATAVVDDRIRGVAAAGSVVDAARMVLDNLLAVAPSEVRERDRGPAPQHAPIRCAQPRPSIATQGLGHRMVAALAALGYDAIVVPCADDAAITAVVPFTAWVETRRADS